MSRPRVLIFSLAYLPFVGGAEVAVKELTDRLSDQFEFEIISADVRNFWSKYFYPFWATRLAKRKHKIKKYDLVWAIMANQAGIAGAWFKNCYPAVPFLLTLQEGDDLDSLAYRARLLLPKIFGVFKKPDQIQAISNYLANWAIRMGASCPITVIPNGVNLTAFPEKQTNTDKVIITTSRLVEKNGVDILIKSLAFLPDDVRLQIVGAGPERENLERLTMGLKLPSRVSFLGQVKSEAVGQYLARASVFCRPSRSEGLGNSFLEAMAAGVPVIGTPVGGIPDFLRDNETGWFCKTNDPEDLANKVRFVFAPENQTKVQQVINSAQKVVRENYDWDKLALKMSKLLYC